MDESTKEFLELLGMDLNQVTFIDTDKFDIVPKKEYKIEVIKQRLEATKGVKDAYKELITANSKELMKINGEISELEKELAELEEPKSK